jgi:VWA domain containing CoxE-like protein
MIRSSRCAPKPNRPLFFLVPPFLLACLAVAGDCAPPTILVTAVDGNFRVEPNLQANDLLVEVQRKQVQVLSVSHDSHPRRIVLMVDSSGSMEASQQRSGWGITLPAAAYAVDVVPASASAALVTFSHKPQRESSSFEDRKAVGARVLDLKRRQPQGGTKLFDSIHQVLNDFTELGIGDAIYLVTDAGENKSKTSLAQIRQELISRGIRIFIFLVQRNEKQSEEEIRGGPQMEDLAEFTGGEVVRISLTEIAGSNRAQLNKLAARIVDQVENVDLLQLGVPAVESATRVRVSFVDRNRGGSSNIAYSHQIAPCSPTRSGIN